MVGIILTYIFTETGTGHNGIIAAYVFSLGRNSKSEDESDAETHANKTGLPAICSHATLIIETSAESIDGL